MLWEYSPSLANIASDWLRADEEEIKMYDGVDTSLVGGAALSLGSRMK